MLTRRRRCSIRIITPSSSARPRPKANATTCTIDMWCRRNSANVLPFSVTCIVAGSICHSNTNFSPLLYPIFSSRMSYFALFDGHAGCAAATFACDTFLKKLPQLCEKYSAPSYSGPVLVKNVKKIFVNMFKDVEEDFLVQARSSTPPLKDGSTATLLLLIDDYLYTANLGDTRAVLARKKTNEAGETVYLAMPITVDHTPMKAEEQARIRKAGGFIKDGRVQGVIEISRSIGDFAYKAFGLCAQPDIQKVCLSLADKFVILACDGLWNVFTNDEAVTFVVRKIRAGIHKINDDENRHVSRTNPNFSPLKNALLCSAATDLMKAAIARGSKDNITIILIGFKTAMLDM
uniref:PPM-type phosphatase domain-containing protein n=1 Tax=Panagrellus redivivus TaxID=6233 RepID=A0A7E4V6T7_PANRE